MTEPTKSQSIAALEHITVRSVEQLTETRTKLADTEAERDQLAAAVQRVRTECDAIEAEIHGQHDEDDDGMREAIRRLRAALDSPTTPAEDPHTCDNCDGIDPTTCLYNRPN